MIPSFGMAGGVQSGAQGEFAPVRVSSHGLIWMGSNVTGAPAGERYTHQEMWRPTFLPTVALAGGCMARFARGAASVVATALSVRVPRFDTAAPARPAPRNFGMPSSVTSDATDTGCPTFTVSALLPCTFTTGGLFARTSGLLDPAPSAPVSDAFTTSSTL